MSSHEWMGRTLYQCRRIVRCRCISQIVSDRICCRVVYRERCARVKNRQKACREMSVVRFGLLSRAETLRPASFERIGPAGLVACLVCIAMTAVEVRAPSA